MLFTVEYNREKRAVEIHLDGAGLQFFMERLSRSPNSGREHFMTPAWGGHELTAEAQASDVELINHLIVHCWMPPGRK
jgi:hypothetical protein